jgi:N-acetylglucosaminyl-diphospho-decaprenol L-rhamnosyltransferase
MVVSDVGIVIVNWNTRDLLKKCLETVFASQGDFVFTVVVVDNASNDGSVAMVRDQFPDVKLITSDFNGGYPYGNNLGLRALGFHGANQIDAEAPRYALLLNPDTEVPPEAIYRMVAFMDANPDVGVAGPKLLMPDGTFDKACRRSFPSPQVAFYHFSGLAKLFPDSERFARYNMTFKPIDELAEVDSVVGAYMQVRREAIEDVGLLDEDFFMYGEDLDWAYRIKAAGWKVIYDPEVVVWHVKRAASRKNRRAQFEFYRAMLIFYRKHYRATTPLWLHSLVMLGLLLKGGLRLLKDIRQSPLQPTSA